jgi:hypothetical protein
MIDAEIVLDRPIAFHRYFVDVTKSISAALMLSQAIYWSKRTKDDAGWFYKSQAEWQEETGLTRREQETARRRLKQCNLLEEKRAGNPARLFYRLGPDLQRLPTSLAVHNQYGGKRQSRLAQSAGLDCTKAPVSLNTETTQRLQDVSLEDELIVIEDQRNPKTVNFHNLIPKSTFLPYSVEFLEAWGNFVADRKERRKPLTSRAADMLLTVLARHPERATEAVNACIQHGWTGFKWEWLDRNKDVSPTIPVRRMPSAEQQRKARET